MNECNLNNDMVRCRNKHCVLVRVKGEREGGAEDDIYVKRENGGGGGGGGRCVVIVCLLSWCLTSIETVWLIRDEGKSREREPRPTSLFAQI